MKEERYIRVGSTKSEVGRPKPRPGLVSLFTFSSNLPAPLSTFTQEVGSRKSEVGSLKGNLVSDFLFLISYFLFPGKGKENKEHRIMNNEYRITNNESGSSLGNLVSDSLFLISYFLFPGKEKENNEYRIRKSEVRSRKWEARSPKREPGFDSLFNHCSNLPAPLSPLAKGDEIRPLVAGSEGVVTPANAGKENTEYRIILAAAEGIVNLLAANPDGASRSVRVGTPDKPGKENENNEHRIMNNEYRITNNESGSSLGNLVSDSIFPVERPGRLIIYFLFPEKGKRPEITQGRVEIAPGIKKMTHGRVEIAPELKKMTHGRVEIAPGIKKMTHGRLKIAPGLRKMTHGRLKIASGIKKMTQGRVKTTQGRVEYAPGPLPVPHGTISPYAFTAPYGVGTPERPEMGLIKGENKEQRISNNECRITNNESGNRETEVGSPKPEPVFDSCKSNLFAPLSPLAKGDEFRPLVAGSEGVVTPANVGKENKEHRITNNEYRISNNEAGSQKSEVRSFSGTPVSYFLFPEKGKENNEHRISNNEYRIRKAEDGIRNLTSNDTSTSFLSPSPFGEGRGEAKYKTLSRLPQESGFNSGDCPGAAAITIFYSFYSSPRVSPNFAGTTQKNLPVANQQAFHQGSIVPNVPLVRGTKSAGWQIGGGIRGTSPDKSGRRGYLPFHRNLMFEALNQKGGTPMS